MLINENTEQIIKQEENVFVVFPQTIGCCTPIQTVYIQTYNVLLNIRKLMIKLN